MAKNFIPLSSTLPKTSLWFVDRAKGEKKILDVNGVIKELREASFNGPK